MKTFCLLPIAYCLLFVPHFQKIFFSEDVAYPCRSKGHALRVFEKQFSSHSSFTGENSFSKNLDSSSAHIYDAEKHFMEKLTGTNQLQKTTVVHCKKQAYDVYIGRPGKWGNPFSMMDGYSREQAISKYRSWIVQQWDLLADLNELKGKVLGCYCKPNNCHGDVLVELIEKLVSDDDEDEEPELPFQIQIIECSDHYEWYEQSLFEIFQVVAINDAEQTYTVCAYDAYGREDFREVNISDCKIQHT